MAPNKLTKKRAELLAELENIIGNNCYNGSIQNYGPNGAYYGEGRSFRYPLTAVDPDGTKRKFRSAAKDLSPEVLSTGYYAFGANRLHIVTAIDEVLRHLEQNYGLKI
jgi:hypothetical protein